MFNTLWKGYEKIMREFARFLKRLSSRTVQVLVACFIFLVVFSACGNSAPSKPTITFISPPPTLQPVSIPSFKPFATMKPITTFAPVTRIPDPIAKSTPDPAKEPLPDADIADSSYFHRVSYDEEDQTMTVVLESASHLITTYYNVSPKVWTEFCNTGSTERYFRKYIVGQYKSSVYDTYDEDEGYEVGYEAGYEAALIGSNDPDGYFEDSFPDREYGSATYNGFCSGFERGYEDSIHDQEDDDW